MDDDDEDHLDYNDSTILKSIVEQHDDEMTTSTLNSSSIDTNFREDEQQRHGDTQNSSWNRRRVRVKFDYSFDNDRLLSTTQTTVIKSEPCFKVTVTADQMTKHFYQNQSRHNKSQIIPKEDQTSQPVIQRMPSEVDSLEDQYLPTFTKEKKKPMPVEKQIIGQKRPVPDRVSSSSSPVKSILKKCQKKEEASIPKISRSVVSRSRSRSPSSSKKKVIPSTRLDFNEVQYLAEVTAKYNSSPSVMHPRSLFEQTINIFDPDNSYPIGSNIRRPSRLQHYIKPYRGEANVPSNLNKQRSRSLSQNRIAQQSGRATLGETPPRQYTRPSTRQSNRKQHVSWSPGRENLQQGVDNIIISPTKKLSTTRKEISFSKLGPSSLSTSSTLSLSNPYLQSSPSMIPLPVRYQTSRSYQVSQSISSSTDSYDTPSLIDRPLPTITPSRQHSYNREEKESGLTTSRLPERVNHHRKEHDQTIQRYDRLLEKMRTTDEQLQSLSRLWINNKQQKTPVTLDQRSSLLVNKTTSHNHFLTPMMLQICLIILVIFNLLVAYFFTEINVWWSEYVAPTVILEQHDEDTSNY